MDKELNAVRIELESEIFEKLKQIKENVLTKGDPKTMLYVQQLSLVNDELTDVLLNWEPSFLDNGLSG